VKILKKKEKNNMATISKGRVTFTEEGSQAAFGYVKGEAKWAKVLEVDDYGNYSISLYGDQVAELEEELKAMQESAAKEVEELGKKYVLADLFKEDNDGKKFLGFKLPEKKFDGTYNKITIYDAGGKKVDDWDKLIGNGSIVKIKYRIAPYYMSSTKMVGISFKFYAIQVIDLVEYSQGDNGFGDETGNDTPFDTDEDF
jgi:hypothetical protein